jgi:hypothetical protein
MSIKLIKTLSGITAILLIFTGCKQQPQLTDEQVENIIKRSFQYFAMYNVNNKFAIRQGGYNTMVADTKLKDHTMTSIARPNNDTFYATALLDLRKEPIILNLPAINSTYVSLMVTAYDHYVDVPKATRKGDFKKPEKILFYSDRTEGYKGETVQGIDTAYKTTGDFISAVVRVMPHANEPEKFKTIIEQMGQIKIQSLSEYNGGKTLPAEPVDFPEIGKTDVDIFANNLLEVMQFVFNHVSFDPNDELDKGVLEAYKPLGIEPGKTYDPATAVKIDGQQFKRIAEKIVKERLSLLTNPNLMKTMAPRMFKTKGKTDLETLLTVSVIGPIGLPMEEAMYPNVATTDGQPINAMNDYVIRMTKTELPPAGAFWSLTLYDSKNGFFIPNDRKKYSVGLNSGYKLNKKGGIDIYIAERQPKGVPPENWLPINRKDENLDVILRVYVPDLEKMKTWQAPKAEKI